MIELINISKKINNNIIIDDVSCIFKSGMVYGIVGRNGSGKSMLFKIIAGLVTPTKGSVIVNSENIVKNQSFPKSTRAIINSPNFLENETAYENLEMLASIENIISKEDIENMLKVFNLLDVKDELVKEYSLGMKQKLALVQVFMENPDIIILDEPFNSLDKKSVELLRDVIKEEKLKGKTIILSSHIKEDIEILCDEIYNIDAGKIKKI
ncbi:MAG: ABC transporter ATP-binding protein [Clostridia bacterium]